jgi:hypothetical protein
VSSNLCSPTDVVDALKSRMRVGEGLTVPYARKWSIGGCEAAHSLWNYPHDAISDLARGLINLGAPVSAIDDSVVVDMGSASIWIAVNGNSRNAEKASAFLLGRQGEPTPAVVLNSPEVALEIIKSRQLPTRPVQQNDVVQIGFPGIDDDSLTYVGSWQWNVHGEAHDEEFLWRAANATLTAIEEKVAADGH